MKKIERETIMKRVVSYEHQTLKSANPLARFAHQMRYRNALIEASKHALAGATVVDFGAGTGEFLHQLRGKRPDLKLIAFEPFMPITYPEIQAFCSTDEIENESVDLLCAFETFEHLTPSFQAEFIKLARRVCRVNAKIIISVPIMQGLALPFKEINRVVMFRRFSDYSAYELLCGTVGLSVDRAANILTSHKGFDHRLLFDELISKFKVVDQFYSPIRVFPWWCNSQAFFVFSL